MKPLPAPDPRRAGDSPKGKPPVAAWALLALLLGSVAWDLIWILLSWNRQVAPGTAALEAIWVLLTLGAARGVVCRKRWGWWIIAVLAVLPFLSLGLALSAGLSMRHTFATGMAGTPPPRLPFRSRSMLAPLAVVAAELALLFRRDVLEWTSGRPDHRLRRAAMLGVAGCLGPVALASGLAAGAILVLPHLPAGWNAAGFFGGPSPFSPFDHVSGTATLLRDGRVLLTGWQSPSGKMTAEFFVPATGQFTRAPDMPHARAHGSVSVQLQDGRVLVAGGRDPAHEEVTAIDVFDPATQAWRTLGAFEPDTRIADATALGDGSVLFTSEEGGSAGLLRFDPGTGTLAKVGHPDMVVNGSPMASRLADGKVLITHLQYSKGDGHPNAFLFDPATRSTRALPRMAQDRSQHQVTVLQDGRVLITGGAEGPPSAELFDPVQRVFRPAGAMLMPRSLHRAIALRDGRVLIVGGVASTRPGWGPDPMTLVDKSPEEIVRILKNSPRPRVDPAEGQPCEIYDPRTGSFTKCAPPPYLAFDGLGTRTGLHLLLPDGRVLFMGMRGPVCFDPKDEAWHPLRPDARERGGAGAAKGSPQAAATGPDRAPHP